jgi:amino acid transporter
MYMLHTQTVFRLIIGSGTALVRGGPLGLLLGYAYGINLFAPVPLLMLHAWLRFMGLVCWSVMTALGEMAAYLPHKKGFAGYTSRYVDPALGFALSVNYLLKYLIVTPNKWSDLVTALTLGC